MRLFRHLTFSNVIALIALFVALGGAAYAGTKINGKTIVNKSIGGGKLKNETITANKLKKGTITSAQIAPGSIDSTQINISTLATVPSAQTAVTAQSATTAQTAANATSAQTAKTADSADTAATATDAAHATSAGDAETLEGKSAAELRAELTAGCSYTATSTEPYGGMCWDQTARPINFWLNAVKICANAGGRLPLIGELIAFVSQTGTQVSGQTWSGDLVSVGGGEKVLTSDDEENLAESGPSKLGYRCVFPLSN